MWVSDNKVFAKIEETPLEKDRWKNLEFGTERVSRLDICFVITALPAEWPWASHLTFLASILLVCKTGEVGMGVDMWVAESTC